MDWVTLLASASISAVIGTFFSLLTVSRVTVQRARAERREAARMAVAAEVKPLLIELARYEYQRGRDTTKREAEGPMYLEDHSAVVRIRAAASDLSWPRRQLVDHRCRRVFGDYWVNLARDYPTEPRSDGDTVTSFFAASLRKGEDLGGDPREAMMHRAYSRPPGDKAQRTLRRELRRLAGAR